MPIHGGRRGARRGLLKGSVAGEDPSPGLGPRPGSEAWVQGLSPCFCSSALRDLGMGGGRGEQKTKRPRCSAEGMFQPSWLRRDFLQVE